MKKSTVSDIANNRAVRTFGSWRYLTYAHSTVSWTAAPSISVIVTDPYARRKGDDVSNARKRAAGSTAASLHMRQSTAQPITPVRTNAARPLRRPEPMLPPRTR